MARARIEVRLESNDFPAEDVQIREVVGRERISQLYAFDVTLLCRHDATQPFAGALATLVFLTEGQEVRRVHGRIAELKDRLDPGSDYAVYELRIVPRLWQATLFRTQEVFIDQTGPGIVATKLDLLGLGSADLQTRLLDTYPKREFIVQYAETDLAFASRLLEHMGISFFFEHGDTDTVVLTDHNGGFSHVGAFDFRGRGEGRDVFALEVTTRLVPSMYIVSDYNYETPHVDLAQVFEAKAYAGGVVEYGTHHRDPAEGARFAKVRAEERLVDAVGYSGRSDVCALAAGARFLLDGHPKLPPTELLVVELEHRYQETALTSGGDESQAKYGNVFHAIPAATPYRPPRVTPRPRIFGVTSGIVESAPGIEVERPWIDEQGRYLVRVLFDTAAVGERKASLPIRMSQPHSGPGYGVHFPLRPGTEVLLSFVDGDPDRPVIVGSVPNTATPTPVAERDATRHRIKTASGVIIEIEDGR